jgi:hypothetical protein
MVVPAHFGMWMKMQRYLCEINLNFASGAVAHTAHPCGSQPVS